MISKFSVQLIRDVTDCHRIDIEVQAQSPEEAGVLALERYEADPDNYEFRFWQCGKEGEVTVGEITEILRFDKIQEDPHAAAIREAAGLGYEGVRRALNILGDLANRDSDDDGSNWQALDHLRSRFAPEMDQEA